MIAVVCSPVNRGDYYTLTAKDPKQPGLEESLGLGVDSLGVYCLGPPILDLEPYSSVESLGVYSLAGNRFWI